MAYERLIKLMGGVPAPADAAVVPTPASTNYLLMTTGSGADAYSWGVQLSYLLDRTNHTGNIDAGIITTGTIDIARLPAGALERMVIVADQAARYALTTADVQLGDTVKQMDNDSLWYVVDTANLSNASGYQAYTASTATAVAWTGITSKPQIITDLAAIGAGGANGDFLVKNAGAWTYRTPAQVKTTLSLDNVDNESVVARRTTGTLASSAGTLTVPANVEYHSVTLTENVTTLNFSSLPGAGQGAKINVLINSGAGGFTFAWPASFKWVGGAGTVSTAAGVIDLLELITFDNGTTWLAKLTNNYV